MMKTRIRKANFRAARELLQFKAENAKELVQKAHSIIATAVQKGVFHQ